MLLFILKISVPQKKTKFRKHRRSKEIENYKLKSLWAILILIYYLAIISGSRFLSLFEFFRKSSIVTLGKKFLNILFDGSRKAS